MDKFAKSLEPIKKILQPLLAPILRYYTFIGLLLVLGFLAYTALSVNSLLNTPRDENYYTEQMQNSVKTDFDEMTILEIRQLRDPDQAIKPILPSGRYNPFVSPD